VRRLWQDVWTSFKAVSGPVLAGAGLVLAILGPLYVPDKAVQVSLIWVAVASLGILTLLLTAGNMVMAARQLVRPDAPRAIRALVPANERQRLTLVMGRSRQFGVNILVTVYHEDHLSADSAEILEQAIGVGQVINSQESGLIQIRVLREDRNHAVLWERIRGGDMAVLSRVVIKPSIDFNAAGIEVRIDE
jgi:hypothetical protein